MGGGVGVGVGVCVGGGGPCRCRIFEYVALRLLIQIVELFGADRGCSLGSHSCITTQLHHVAHTHGSAICC